MVLLKLKALAEEFLKPIIRKCEKQELHSSFIANIWGADPTDIRVINIFSKYARVVPSKDKEGIIITNTFHEILDNSKRKPNKIWVDKGSEFYNRSVKSWLQDNDIEMNSTHNEGKSVVAERFIKTLKNELYKYMTSVSKMCILIN